MTTWQVSVYSTATDELIAEHDARSPDRGLVRQEWGLEPGSPIGSLPVTSERLTFVNALLPVPLVLQDGQEAFLEEFAEYDGKVVTD